MFKDIRYYAVAPSLSRWQTDTQSCFQLTLLMSWSSSKQMRSDLKGGQLQVSGGYDSGRDAGLVLGPSPLLHTETQLQGAKGSKQS